MEADGLEAVVSHVLKLLFADFYINFVIDDPEIGDGAVWGWIIEVVWI